METTNEPHHRSLRDGRRQHAGAQAVSAPNYTVHMSHESVLAQNLGIPGDAMTFQTNFIGMLDHVGAHVDAFRHVSPRGAAIDEMPLDLFMGKAICFDLRHIPDLGEITETDMEQAQSECGFGVSGHIVLLCTGFPRRNYPSVDSVWKNPRLSGRTRAPLTWAIAPRYSAKPRITR
jgi:hypothetical protein